MANNESFILFTENRDVFDSLPDAECAALIRAIFQYEDEGTIPDLPGAARYVFLMIKKTLDRNEEKYEKVREARSKAGKKSAEARKKANKSEQNATKGNNAEQAATKQTVNVNVNVNDNDNVSKEKRNYLGEFETLWLMYPRKQGKSDARRHYVKAAKEGTTFEEVETGIHAYENYVKEAGVDPQYIKMGSSFFCQRAWADDWTVPAQKPRPNNGGPYQPEPPKYPEFEPDPEVDAVQMPDEIRKRLEGLYYE